MAESHQTEQDIIEIAQKHKQWIKDLIAYPCKIARQQEVSELIYTLLEGMISRFLVDGFNKEIAEKLKAIFSSF